MTDTRAEELKTKLHNAINKRMQLLKQGKTEAVSGIAAPLDVQPRQIYKWLNAESVPHNAENLILTLDTMMNDMEKFKSDIRSPGPSTPSFPFRMTIPKQSLVFTKDDHGNILISGSMLLDLL